MEKSKQFASMVKKEVARKEYDQGTSFKNPLYSGDWEPKSLIHTKRPPEGTAEMVPVSSLRSIQKSVDPNHVAELARTPAMRMPPIEVAADRRGRLWVWDGNHRATAALQRGDDAVLAKVHRES